MTASSDSLKVSDTPGSVAAGQTVDTTATVPNKAQTFDQRINNYFGHAVDMINQIQGQYEGTKGFENVYITNLFREARAELEIEKQRILGKFANEDPNKPHEKHEISALKEELESANKKIAGGVAKLQVQVAAKLAAYLSVEPNAPTGALDNIQAKAATYAQGGVGSWKVYFLSFVSSTDKLAIKKFREAKTIMTYYSQQVEKINSTEAEKDSLQGSKKADFDRDKTLKGRAGVIEVGGHYSILPFFTQKEVSKQYSSFTAQRLSDTERTTLSHQVAVGSKKFKDSQVPLNARFDKALGIAANVFEKIFGEKGISSANRAESQHLMNGYQTELKDDTDKTVFHGFRHAIIATEKGSANDRVVHSNQAAEELLKAALLHEIAQRGMTLAQAKESGISLNLNSVSLVTPDLIRNASFLHDDDERRMLADQTAALGRLKNKTSINIDGHEIPIAVDVCAFNFGVNRGAVNWHLGLTTQFQQNKVALKNLNQQMLDVELALGDQALALIDSDKEPDLKKLDKAKDLMKDINRLMKDEKAYLDGGNQYEIGAKILLVTNLMEQIVKAIHEDKDLPADVQCYKCAFNCKSGKDRTGIMDAVAKTFAAFEKKYGYYPSHEQLSNPDIQGKCLEIYKAILANEQITLINTGAKGLKVKKEARLFGMDQADFAQIQGLSETTSA